MIFLQIIAGILFIGWIYYLFVGAYMLALFLFIIWWMDGRLQKYIEENLFL